MKADKKNYSYFDAFFQLAQYSLQAAEVLSNTLQQFNQDELKQRLTEMQEIEDTADTARHDLLKRLEREFLPPIEREDIYRLAEEIDDVTDAIEDVLININIFNVQSIPVEIVKFAEVLQDCCKALSAALSEFENFRKSKTLHVKVVEVNRLEEAANTLYRQGIRNLVLYNKDPVALIVWKEIYSSLEKCCNACEIVANDLEKIALINS